MAFRSGSSGGFSRGGRSGGSRFGGGGRGFGGGFGRDRDSGRFDRGPREMHNATCDKCGKSCQVPFKPTPGKPIYCSDCFSKNESSGSNFGSRNQSGPSSSGMSPEQFNQIDKKLNKILKALSELELDTGDADEGDDAEVELLEEDEDGDDEHSEESPKSE